LRLSLWLGDSSCRLDEAPLKAQEDSCNFDIRKKNAIHESVEQDLQVLFHSCVAFFFRIFFSRIQAMRVGEITKIFRFSLSQAMRVGEITKIFRFSQSQAMRVGEYTEKFFFQTRKIDSRGKRR